MTKKKRKLLKTKRAEEKLKRDTFNLDYSMIDYFYTHLIAYKRYAGDIIDLSFYKFNHNGKEYTQEEMIDKAIQLCLIIKSNSYEFDEEKNKKSEEAKNELFDILKAIFFCLWW